MAEATRLEGVPEDAVDISDRQGLYKRILTPGDEAEGTPFEGAEVQVHYVGTLLSDGSKFDSSRDRPGNFKFKIGQGQVIKGWDKGVATMHKGEKAELFCRSDYAYGESGSPPKIPGGATLKFEVELLSWAAAGDDAKSSSDGEGDGEPPKMDAPPVAAAAAHAAALAHAAVPPDAAAPPAAMGSRMFGRLLTGGAVVAGLTAALAAGLLSAPWRALVSTRAAIFGR